MVVTPHTACRGLLIPTRSPDQKNRESATVDELSQKLVALEEKLGPEYAALMDGLQDINPESKVGQEIESVLLGLDDLCGG